MSPFEVPPADIALLSDEALRALVKRMAERHLEVKGLPRSAVTAGGPQDAPDGGIDVRVDLVDGRVDGFVPRAQTGFQVKATRMGPADILAEMRPNGALRSAIKRLAEDGGAYVIVASKDDPADDRLTLRLDTMAEAIADDPAAAALHVDFYGRDRLAQWVNEHPGIVAWVHATLGRPIAGWRPYGDWSSSPRDLDEPYLLDEGLRLSIPAKSPDGDLSAEAGLTALRRLLAKAGAAVRLVGLSGVGKTRFAQALFDDRVGEEALSPASVVYGDLGANLEPHPERLVEQLGVFGRHFILIVDNCGWTLHDNLAKAIGSGTAPISLLTIEYEVTDDEREGTDVLLLDAASEELIRTILKARRPDLSGPDRARIAAFSGGNFRIALALAHTTAKGESVATLGNSELLDRLLFQRQAPDPALRRAAGIMSLVYSVDVATLDGEHAELPLLASLAGQSPQAFFQNIAALKARGLVQQRGNYRALLPHAIAHRLAKEALEIIHPDQVRQGLIDRAPERLLKSFSRRLGCLHDSPHAQAIVHDWLGDGGRLGKVEQLDAQRWTVFENVAPVDPQAALDAIARGVQRAGVGAFDTWHVPRLLTLLRNLAYEPGRFATAAMLIRAFARPYAEKDRDNGASDQFAQLFHIVLSGTHAPPEMRAGLVRRLARSADPADQALALTALRAMLACGSFASNHRFEFGARKRDYGYHPRTAGGSEAWFASVFALCRELDREPELSARVRRLVAVQVPGIVKSIGVIPALETLAQAWAGNGRWPEGWVACRRAQQLIRERRTEDAARLGPLIDLLAPREAVDRLRSHVLLDSSSGLDLLHLENADDAQRFARARETIEADCVAIGEALAADEASLASVLRALLAIDSNRVLHVGRGLIRSADHPETVWRSTIEAFRGLSREERGPGLLGGAMKGLAERDRALADRLLDEALHDPDLQQHVVWLQSVAGLDEAGAKRMTEAAKQSAIATASFSELGREGACDELPAGQMAAILDAIAARDDGPDVAIDVFTMRLLGLRQRNAALEDVEKRAGLRLLARVRFSRSRNDGGYRIAEIAGACLDPRADEGAARGLLARFAEVKRSGRASFTTHKELLTLFAERFPQVLLDVLVDPDDAEADVILHIGWDDDDEAGSIIAKIPDQVLLNWAAEHPDRRAPAVASVIRFCNAVPSTAGDGRGSSAWTATALNLLPLPKDPRPVLDAFFARLHPGSLSGSRSDQLLTRLPLIEALTDHADARVARWATDAADRLQQEITYWQQQESDRLRRRDERFEA